MKEEQQKSKFIFSLNSIYHHLKDRNDTKIPLILLCIENKKKKSYSRKHYYSSEVTKILMNWLKDHIYYPYPTEEERIQLCKKTELTRKQLRVWLINARKVRKFDSSSLLKLFLSIEIQG
jgi:hypothetical protein